MSLEPMENPSKCSRNSSASTRVGGQLAHHDDLQAVLAAAQPVLAEQVDHALGLGQGADERDHDLDVGQAHRRRGRTRSASHSMAKQSAKSARQVPGGARGSRSSGSPRAARSGRRRARLAYSLDLKSLHPHDHRLGRERRGDGRDPLGDAAARRTPAGRGTRRSASSIWLFSGSSRCVELEQRLGVDADLPVDDELQPGQPDPGVRAAARTRTPGPACRRSS